MNIELPPSKEIMLHRSISPMIIVETNDENEIREKIREGLRIEAVTRKVAMGECSLWDAFELLECFNHDMDQWLDEIELNMMNNLKGLNE